MKCKRCERKPAMIDNSVCGECHNKTIMADFNWRPKPQTRNEHYGICVQCKQYGIIYARCMDMRCYRRARQFGTIDRYARVRP